MAGYICDQLGWDERAKTMLSFTLDVAVSVAVIGFTIAFPEFAMTAIALKVGSSLWSNGIIKNQWIEQHGVVLQLIYLLVGQVVMQ